MWPNKMAVASRLAQGSLCRLTARLSRCSQVLTGQRRYGSTIVPVDDMISGLTDTQMQVRVQLLIKTVPFTCSALSNRGLHYLLIDHAQCVRLFLNYFGWLCIKWVFSCVTRHHYCSSVPWVCVQCQLAQMFLSISKERIYFCTDCQPYNLN